MLKVHRTREKKRLFLINLVDQIVMPEPVWTTFLDSSKYMLNTERGSTHWIINAICNTVTGQVQFLELEVVINHCRVELPLLVLHQGQK